MIRDRDQLRYDTGVEKIKDDGKQCCKKGEP